ncbi:DciA family protein [Kitasatospora sp. NPDC101801]|uniref:DciA family protein n=1 Tax=Kitasatospora sp. NPDC101801 TaxID=3364103 RepID=UPI0037FA4406
MTKQPAPPGSPMRPVGIEGQDLAWDLLRAYKENARRRGDFSLRSGLSRTPMPRFRVNNEPELALRMLIEELQQVEMYQRIAPLAHLQAAWGWIVGPEIAEHARPIAFNANSGLLTLATDSTAWTTQLGLLSRQLIARVKHELPHVNVRAFEFSAEAAGSRTFDPATAHRTPPPRKYPDPVPYRPRTALPGAEAARAHLHHRLEADQAGRAARRQEDERTLAVPAGWLSGTENLNPRPPSAAAERKRFAAATAAALRARQRHYARPEA